MSVLAGALIFGLWATTGPTVVAQVGNHALRGESAEHVQDPGGDEPEAGDDDSSTDAPDEAAVRLARIERLIELSISGRAVVRPQAAERLVGQGADAVSILLARAGDEGQGFADFGPQLVQVLADFDDPQLRERLWWQLDELEFPWRPQAAGSLAGNPAADEIGRFRALIKDRLARVRIAAVHALAQLGPDAPTDDGAAGPNELLLRDRLADPDERVRRAAAGTLYAWGDGSAAFWLLEDLRREDHFFQLPTGERARFASAKLLEQALGDLDGFDPALDPDELDARLAWRRLEKRLLVANGGGRPDLPEIARAGTQEVRAVFGLELRSCRHGDIYLRWTKDDVLYVGTGRPVRLALVPGTVETLLGGISDRVERLGDDRFWGESGCDTEQLHWRPPGADRTKILLVSKGAQPVPNLRPKELSDVARALLASLPDAPHDDPRASRLRTRVADALTAIGGPTGSR